MIGRKLLCGFLLICLPAAGATALMAIAYWKLVPIYENRERSRITGEYREVAADLKENPERGADVVPLRRGDWRSMKPGRWGYVVEGASAVVWYSEGRRIQSVSVPRVDGGSVEFYFAGIGVAILAALWGLTLAGCWMFRKSVKERDDFVAATAHDLTTPLVAMRRLIGRDDAEAKVLAERMVRLVENLTVFLRLGGKRPAPKLETVDLRKAYDEAYALFREDYRWQFGGKDVPTEGPDAPLACADATMCVQIIWNLLANDLKYAAPYGPVSVRFEADDACVRVHFVDGGKGLSADERRKIFNRYYRVKSVMKSGKGGFGIGLCTAREFARAMGGDLAVAAHEPTGCVFTLTLRRAR